MKNPWIKFHIKQQFDQKSIRDFLMHFDVSKKKIYKLDVEKAFKVNRSICHVDTVLNKGDLLELNLSILNTSQVQPISHDIDVVYEDDDMIILNKSVDCLVYSDGIDQHTLTNFVNANRPQSFYTILPVHRIDYETSGLVVFAKHPLTLSYLSKLFENHEVEKWYVCLVENHLKNKKGFINQPIGKDRHSNLMRVSPSGKKAYTSYEVLEERPQYSLLRVNIKSGRKHQIRVHLRSIGYPVVSDKLYGHINLNYKRLMLHFETIKFVHPRTFKPLIVSSKADF